MSMFFSRFKPVRLLDAILLSSFFLSGVSALIYQVGWQRSLYGVIGVDIESITIIVSVFMLGIGFGGMLGGWLADLAPRRRVQFYAAIELSIALYGFFSLFLINLLDSWHASASGASVNAGVSSLLFLIFPTVLMGMTLPLLTMVFNEWQDSIGVSVGQLYFINTLGASVGAGLVPFVLLHLMPLDDVIRLAALGNLAVAILALVAYLWQGKQSKQLAPAGGQS